MKFSMSAAWNDAVGLMRGNREVLAVVAGVFFLLPGLVFAVLFAEQQALAMEMLRGMMQGQLAQSQPPAMLTAMPGWFIAAGIAAFFVQMIGYLALLALMDSDERPTVGEALGTALKCLLPLIGAILLFVVGYVIFALIAGLVIGAVVGVAALVSQALAALLSVVLFIALFLGIVWICTRLSLTLAEMVLGRQLNPIKAYIGSWRLTKGNSLRLFLFYLLLLIVYMVISMVVFGVLFGAAAALPDTAGGLFMGIVSGLLGAVVGVVYTAIIAAVYRQLSGPSAAAVSETFE